MSAPGVNLGGLPLSGATNETGIGRQCKDLYGNSSTLLNNTLSTWYQLNCISTYTVDSQIFTTMWTTAVVGMLCLAVFCWGQSFCSVYRGRLLSPNVALKPPVLTGRNFWAKYFGWLWVTLAMSENELLATAGMDALMFERLIIFCLQFIFPVMVVSVSALIPIHLSSEFLEQDANQQFAKSNLMGLTMGNLKPGATILWVHFVLVVLFTAYGMWLLDQHYKSYVLLRQQYLTRGDTVSAWLGNTPKQRPLASYGSVLILDPPTQDVLFNPLWTFARAKASDSDTGTGAPPSHAVSTGGACGPAAADDAQRGGGGAVLTKLASLQRSSDAVPEAQQQQQQQQLLQQRQQSARQLRAYALPDLPPPPPSRTSSAAAAQAAAAGSSPFAEVQQQELLLPRPTLQMVPLSDVVFTSPPPPAAARSSSGALLDAEQQSTLPPMLQHAAPGSPPAAREVTASPSGSSSAAGSRFASRQSSGRALLAPKHIDSSAQLPHGALLEPAAAPETQQPAGRGVLGGFLRRHQHQPLSSELEEPVAAAAAAAAVSPREDDGGRDDDGEQQLHSAAGAVSGPGGPKAARRQRAGSCAPGCTWRRVSCRSTASEDDGLGAAVSFAEDVDAAEAQHKQRRAARRAAEAAAAAGAAQQLGADVVWWQHKTGDVLLDRHIVQVDMHKELGDAADDPDRPYFWWELAPSDAPSTAGGTDAEASASGTDSTPAAAAAAAAGSNIQPVPNTSLLFDRRSLRARRPSVRFRNTVHVRGHDGSLVPLHVSTYAVLVTDVPDPDTGGGSGGSQRSSSCGVDFGSGRSLCGPFAECCSSLLHMLDHALQFACWGWPCLLSRADLTRHAKGWSHASLRSTHSMTSSAPDAEEQLAQLEAGTLLAGAAAGEETAGAAAADSKQQRQQQWQRRMALSNLVLERPTARQRLVELTFRHLFPGEVQAVIPAQEYKTVNELLREWNRKTQVYAHTLALLDLKRQRQQAKKQKTASKKKAEGAEEGQQQPAAAGADGADVDAAAVGSSSSSSRPWAVSRRQRRQQQQQQAPAGASSQQVCIEVTHMQQQQKVAAHTSAAASADGAAAAAAPPGSSTECPAAPAAAGAHHNGSSSSQHQDGPRPAAQHPDMSRPCSTVSTSDIDLCDEDDESDDEELDCCAAMARRLCCCACCGVGAIQDGGHGLLPPPGDEDLAGSGSTRRCCGLCGRSSGSSSGGSSSGRFGFLRMRRQHAQEPKKGSKDVLAEQRAELLELEAKIRTEQKKVLAGPDTGNFIVLFKTPQAANLAAHSTVYPHTGEVEAFKVQPAPSPEDVLWPSLWASPADRRAVLGISIFWYSILYLIPTGFFAASLNAITLTMCSNSEFGRNFGWMCQPFMQFLLTIVAPFVLLMVWQNAVIPAQMYRLELRRAVAVSLSEMERRILLTYCGWELINLFLGGVLSGSFVSQVQLFFRHPEQWAQVLGAAIPQTSNFFLNYVITRAFMMNFVRLLMPHGGMWRWIGQMLFTGFTGFRHAATASYRACIIYPASIRYGREPGLVLLILLIGMAYCVAAPLITVFVFAYMITAYIVWRYQIIYVCTRAYESGGKMWPAFFLCITWCLGFFVAFTSSMLIFKKGNAQGVLVLILLPVLYIFSRRCRQRYCSKVDHPPLWLSHTAPRSEIDPLVYLPPCLQPNAQGWFFEAGKPWVRWGVPSYNNPKKPGHDDGSCFC